MKDKPSINNCAQRDDFHGAQGKPKSKADDSKTATCGKCKLPLGMVRSALAVWRSIKQGSKAFF
jgi:hypothetical protein